MSSVKLSEVASQHLPAAAEYAVLSPDDGAELHMCLLLMGGGGTREALFDLQPLFDEWWRTGLVLPMRIATPSAGLDYYMEEPSGPVRWDAFIINDFVRFFVPSLASLRAPLLVYPQAAMAHSRLRSHIPPSSMPLPLCSPCSNQGSTNPMFDRATVFITRPAGQHGLSAKSVILCYGNRTIRRIER
jgi:hypothetical protein